MTFDLKQLYLHEDYEFNVVVKDGSNSFAGKLSLTPQECTVTIMGEQTSNRRCSIGWNNVDELICRDLNKIFILKNLVVPRRRESTVTSYPDHIGFFEITFSIGFVLFLPSGHTSNVSVDSISIHSESISAWIGNTQTQEDIILSHNRNKSLFDNPPILDEFIQQANENVVIGVSYNLSIYYSSPEFKSGITFPPTLIGAYRYGLSANEVKSEYDKIYNFISFFVGRDFVPEKIDIGYHACSFPTSGSLYFPTSRFNQRSKKSTVFFPLGKNLRFDQLGLPPFPLEAIGSYFTLPESELEIWRKYAYYSRMANPEERFLGYFRLLEKLCFNTKTFLDESKLSEVLVRVKPYMVRRFEDKENINSFLKGIPRYNQSKYNTSKCIQDFYKTIPKERVETWIFRKGDIDKICKLRNDISHANDFSLGENSLLECENFVHVLLVLAMCSKLQISIDVSSHVVTRIDGYDFITQENA